jgi:hypothetical protein
MRVVFVFGVAFALATTGAFAQVYSIPSTSNRHPAPPLATPRPATGPLGTPWQAWGRNLAKRHRSHLVARFRFCRWYAPPASPKEATMRLTGVISVLALLLTWAALDDITTDTAQRFDFEYMLLVLSGIWFAGIGGWLLVRRRSVLGVGSLAAVAIGIPVYWSLPHRGEPATAVHLLGWIPLVWFLALTLWQLTARSGESRAGGVQQPATHAGDFRVPSRS